MKPEIDTDELDFNIQFNLNFLGTFILNNC